MALLNTYIAASAGAGKTYQLVSRFLTLLSLQKIHQGRVDVSQIIAITFTRKAAAEFKARILADLAQGAQTEQAAVSCWQTRIKPIISEMQLDALLEGAGLRDEPAALKELFTDILAEVMEQFSQLNLGTIDSLFQRIARTLCTELGLARLNPLDTLEEESKWRRALDLTYEHILLQPQGDAGALLEDVVIDSLGEERALSRADSNIFKLVNEYHEILLSSPHALWGGEPDELTEEELRCFGLSRDDIRVSESEQEWRARLHALVALIEQDEQQGKTLFPEPVKDAEQKGVYRIPQRAGAVTMHANSVRAYRRKFLAYVRSIASLHQKLESIEVKELATASAYEQAYNRYAPYWGICYDLGYDLDELLRARRAYVWRGLLGRTRALHQLLGQVEANYQSEVRDQGLFSFSDVARLLRGQLDEQSYALVQERLDARLQHWLLDEFQDTSHEQYGILRDLLLARAQEGDEGSVFMVGDAKQSIYGFRGGDPEIFLQAREELFGLDSPQQMRSQEKPFNSSYRSTQAVLDFVNELFGERFRQYAPLATQGAHCLWDKLQFAPHRAVRSAEEYPGCVEVWSMHKSADELEGKSVAYHFIAELLQQTRPAAALRSGSPLPSCAILVSTTAEGLRLHEALSRLQVTYGFAGPVVYCGDKAVGSDAPLGLALMQLFRWLQSPADQQSLDLLQLTPLWQAVLSLGGSRRWHHLRLLIAQGGIGQLLRELTAGERKAIVRDAYLLSSWKVWVDEADAFDERGGTLQEWIERVKQLRLRDETQGDAIRIMTIHKSKGLEFDMVILPLLATSEPLAAYRKKKILQHQGRSGETYAVLLPPSDESWAEENEQLYSLMIEPWRAQEEFAAFCKLYVALTRAKRATYVVLPAKATSASKRKNESFRHIMEQLIEHAPDPRAGHDEELPEPAESRLASCDYSAGHSYWYEELEGESVGAPHDVASLLQGELLLPQYTFRQLPRRTPSSLDMVPDAEPILSTPHAASAHSGVALGLAIHQLMQYVDWIDPQQIGDRQGFLSMLPPSLQCMDAEILHCLHRALCSPAWMTYLAHRQHLPRLYREQSIEALSQGSWISGQIDRLHVYQNEAGEAQSAEIYDFKTNALSHPRELLSHYKEQMRAYRYMCALAFHLPVNKVSVTLLHCPFMGEASAWSYEESDW